MLPLDDMPINDAIELYYEKHDAIRRGDMEKLIVLKEKHPQIFDKENDVQIRNIIEYAQEFQKSDRYKELLRLEMKGKLSIVN